jgi:hypothetical protein
MSTLIYSNPLDTIEDARDVVRRYGLDRADLCGGTAEGFAAWLFVPGKGIEDVTALASELENYRSEFTRHARNGQSLDELLAIDANKLIDSLNGHADRRRELSDFVRSVKFGPHGSIVWVMISELATTPPPGRQGVLDTQPHLRQRVLESLCSIHGLMRSFSDSTTLSYLPGVDGCLDLLLRMDIERLDVTLSEARPWAGKGPDTCFEICALFRLVAALDAMSAGSRLN